MIAAWTCSVVMFICVGCSLSTFLVVFPVRGVSLVRNSVDECLLKALAMSWGLMCVLFLNVNNNNNK